MDSRENEEFTNLLRGAVREAEKLKYRPTTFKRMLDEHGGFESVNRVLASGKPSDGFTKLWELGRLDLTCEAIIVETKWRRHFDTNLLAKAEKLLGEMRYPFKRFEDEVSTAPPPLKPSGDSAIIEAHDPDLDEQASWPLSDPGMRINAFFKEVLHAPVANVRWSWGAIDERSRRVFLRIWRMDIATWEGSQVVRVLGNRNTNRPGWSERARHLESIRAGYRAYGVVCDKDSPEAGVIRDFDRDSLLQLGRVFDRDGMVYLEITGITAVDTIAVPCDHAGSVASDLRGVDEAEVNATTRAALIDARLGQGRFRRELLRRWNGACAVTGCRVGAVLRASHCKPWSKSDNRERLDSNNGLVLSANLDALFDAGLISFSDAGDMLLAEVISTHEQAQLGLPAKLLKAPGQKLKEYLRFHREHVYLG